MLTHILKKRVCVISTVVEISQISFLRCFDFAQHDICSLGSTAILFLKIKVACGHATLYIITTKELFYSSSGFMFV